ncbi:unnamed protein product [Blepharisma stoltei]|uniref:Uncharacterized protein n=1 Tax=Blepharisma stoltei TaxID=1481888 RepID=A0AAU9JR66_9CILI|nr:unnamed protein product [Blepharisma stoltei]
MVHLSKINFKAHIIINNKLMMDLRQSDNFENKQNITLRQQDKREPSAVDIFFLFYTVKSLEQRFMEETL